MSSWEYQPVTSATDNRLKRKCQERRRNPYRTPSKEESPIGGRPFRGPMKNLLKMNKEEDNGYSSCLQTFSSLRSGGAKVLQYEEDEAVANYERFDEDDENRKRKYQNDSDSGEPPKKKRVIRELSCGEDVRPMVSANDWKRFDASPKVSSHDQSFIGFKGGQFWIPADENRSGVRYTCGRFSVDGIRLRDHEGKELLNIKHSWISEILGSRKGSTMMVCLSSLSCQPIMRNMPVPIMITFPKNERISEKIFLKMELLKLNFNWYEEDVMRLMIKDYKEKRFENFRTRECYPTSEVIPYKKSYRVQPPPPITRKFSTPRMSRTTSSLSRTTPSSSRKIVEIPSDSPGDVSIPRKIILSRNKIDLTKEDVNRLKRSAFLNDQLIDFYADFLTETYTKQKHYIFSCQHYALLKDRLQQEPDRIAKIPSQNPFEKDYLYIPICKGYHWSLVIVCNPKLISKSSRGDNPHCILYCDSMSSSVTGTERIFVLVRQYLSLRYREETNEKHEFTNENLPVQQADLPIQTNGHDCGVYILEYMERFLKKKSLSLPVQKSNWFSSDVITSKRKFMVELIERFRKEEMGDDYVPLDEPKFSQQSSLLSSSEFSKDDIFSFPKPSHPESSDDDIQKVDSLDSPVQVMQHWRNHSRGRSMISSRQPRYSPEIDEVPSPEPAEMTTRTMKRRQVSSKKPPSKKPSLDVHKKKKLDTIVSKFTFPEDAEDIWNT